MKKPYALVTLVALLFFFPSCIKDNVPTPGGGSITINGETYAIGGDVSIQFIYQTNPTGVMLTSGNLTLSLPASDGGFIAIGVGSDTTLNKPFAITSWTSEIGDTTVSNGGANVALTITRETGGNMDGYFSGTVQAAAGPNGTGVLVSYDITMATFHDIPIERIFE